VRPSVAYDDRLDLSVGGTMFELHHGKGETDDHTWAWVPSHEAAVVGDFLIWLFPNAGNPQKVQRYPREWAAALRAMDMLGAEVLCPGHGVPIWGAAAVHRALDDTASFLEDLVDQVVAKMNEGARLDEIVAAVRPRLDLLDRPYLAPIYDEPAFIVRNLYRLYGGWWDGNPAHLKPPAPAALATELATLAGGPAALADRARVLAAAGDDALACELVELAVAAAPADPAIHAARAAIYGDRAKRERSLMARGVYAEAAEQARRNS
jgi:alkyl sulfatase BDS1-like metallo-beta-lactamase superfamily hydrolase